MSLDIIPRISLKFEEVQTWFVDSALVRSSHNPWSSSQTSLGVDQITLPSDTSVILLVNKSRAVLSNFTKSHKLLVFTATAASPLPSTGLAGLCVVPSIISKSPFIPVSKASMRYIQDFQLWPSIFMI